MSGYCPDCGNTLCLCSEILFEAVSVDSYKRLEAENKELMELLSYFLKVACCVCGRGHLCNTCEFISENKTKLDKLLNKQQGE